MDHFEKSSVGQKGLEEELEALRQDPIAQEILDLLKRQDPERTDQLMTTLTTLEEEERAHAQADG